MADPATLCEQHIARFLEHLVLERKVSASTQGQALNALVFFYKQVLQHERMNALNLRLQKNRGVCRLF